MYREYNIIKNNKYNNNSQYCLITTDKPLGMPFWSATKILFSVDTYVSLVQVLLLVLIWHTADNKQQVRSLARSPF